jgi:hypothetical protein
MPDPHDQQYWTSALKEGARSQRVRMPSSQPGKPSLSVRGKPDQVTMVLNTAAVTANLQTDCAAFEAWTLALWAWTEAKHLTLDWEVPAVADQNGHYQRFLFRALMMHALFPDRFQLSRSADHKPFDRVNPPSKRDVPASEDREDSKLEAKLEHHLVRGCDWLRDFEELEDLSAQFPIGTFMGSLKSANRVFTGGKSAIDIVGWDKKGGFLAYELKAGDNIPLGIVSELLFYCSMLDWIRSPHSGPDCPVSVQTRRLPQYERLLNCERLVGVFLAPKFHPLLVPDAQAEQGISPMIDLLNAAWANWADKAVPVNFRWRRVPSSIAQQVS